jgi:hypothetical protein
MDKKDLCNIVNSVRSPAIDGKTCGEVGSEARWQADCDGGPIVARRNVLSKVAALLQRHEPSGRSPGLQATKVNVDPIAFPRTRAVALEIG